MRPGNPEHEPEEAPDSLAPITVPTNSAPDPVTLELIERVEAVVALKRRRSPEPRDS